jgi:hypothetical protein
MTATSLPATDVLTHLVVTFLTPMFLATTGCDLEQAHAAAFATVQACTIRNPLDLLLVGQLIALGLATLSSLSQSMADDLSINQILRLRGNAVSLHRAGERCRAALPEQDSATQDASLSAGELAAEDELIAEVMRARQRVADYNATAAQPQSVPDRPAQPATPKPIPPQADPDFPPEFPDSLATMKAAMAHIVTESDRREAAPNHAPTRPGATVRQATSFAMSDTIPRHNAGRAPAETHTAGIRAAALGTTASHLITATAPPRC